MLTVNFLGPFAARDGAGNAITLPTRKAEALLAVLAFSSDGRQSRDRLLDLFWGAHPEAQARHSLSQTLTTLRRLFGKNAIAADRDGVELMRDRFTIDIVQFIAATKSGALPDLQRATLLYRGPLLDGLMVREVAFQEWLGTERRRLASVAVDVLTRLGRELALGGDYPSAAQAFESALGIDPLADAAHAALMQLHLDRKRLTLVARHHVECVDLYRRELGTRPGAEIDRIAKEAAARRNLESAESVRITLMDAARVVEQAALRSGPAPSSRQVAESGAELRRQVASRRYPSVIVLPFRDLSAQRDRNFIAGVVGDIALALYRLKEFHVIDRQSGVARGQRALDVRRAGFDVGAAYVVKGNVRRSGARYRILIQLVAAEIGTLLWCERFDGAMAGRVGLQDGVASRVGRAVHRAIRNAEIAFVRCKPPATHDAYDLILRAYPLLWSQDRIKNKQAIRLLEASLALDGEYGRAHALLAWCLSQEIVYFWSTDPGRDREFALRAVEAASTFADDDPTAMAAMGAALSQCGDQRRATAWLERALALDPTNAWAWGRYGHVALYSNAPDSAKKRFQHSLDLSPFDPFAFNMRMGIAQALGMEGAYHEAIATSLDVLNEYPSVTWINRTLASYHALTGDITSAQMALKKLIVATPHLSVRAMKHTHPMRHIPRYYDKLLEGLERAGLPDQ